MTSLGEAQSQKRGLTVDGQLRVQGAEGIWAMGDCTATHYAPTAQAASQQGHYLARCFNQLGKKERLEAVLKEAREGKSDADVE
jgi:NADH:ubiquinone reductase (non-electrogenic)